MQRNMDLVRALLLDIEGKQKPDLSDYPEDQISYHYVIMQEGELLKGDAIEVDGEDWPIAWENLRLTWKGHDFLDAARSDAVWKKALGKIASTGSAFTFGIVSEVLKGLIKEKLGLPE